MGRLTNGIYGPFEGKVGGVIGTSWKGIPYIKRAHKKRTKSISKKERANRVKFTKAQYWLSPLLDFVRAGFKGYSKLSEGFVAAKSYLLLNACEGTQPDIFINPALVKVSHGNLPLPANITVKLSAKDLLQFTWDTETPADGDRYDQAMLLAYDIENARAYFRTTGQFRYVGGEQLPINNLPGKTYHIYAAFVAHDRSRQSDSTYLGMINT